MIRYKEKHLEEVGYYDYRQRVYDTGLFGCCKFNARLEKIDYGVEFGTPGHFFYILERVMQVAGDRSPFHKETVYCNTDLLAVSNKCCCFWWTDSSWNYNKREPYLSFEEVLDILSPSTRQKFLFHLDLFV